MGRGLKVLKIGDVLLAAAVLVFVGVWSLSRLVHRTVGQTVIITMDNKVIQTVRLPEVRDFRIQGSVGEVLVRVDGDRVWVETSSCPQKICSRMGKIRHAGQTIICVPNRLIVRIEGARFSSMDAVTM